MAMGMSGSIRQRVKRAHHGQADVIIGKKGVTDAVLREIDARLRIQEIVKVKMLRKTIEIEGEDRRTIARRVAELLGARLMGIRGRTFILYRSRGSAGNESVKKPLNAKKTSRGGG